MPKLKNQMPKMCRDRNQAFSWHNGKRVFHGVWNSPEAEKSYKRFIARLLENPILPLQDYVNRFRRKKLKIPKNFPSILT